MATIDGYTYDILDRNFRADDYAAILPCSVCQHELGFGIPVVGDNGRPHTHLYCALELPGQTVAGMVTHVPFSNRTCSVCGGWMVYIRGRHPRDDRREVCPTCLADRMDDIRETAAKEYGVAYTDKEAVKL